MELHDKISYWLKSYLEKNLLDTFVIGISGGIDSAVTSTLCALTGKRTIVITMPIHQNPKETLRGKNHIKWLMGKFKNVEQIHINLSNIFDEIKKTTPKSFHTKLSLANTKARIRMSALYLIAGGSNGIVVGTGNKVEDFGVGFFTKYGDGGVDISPIADLLKSEVYLLGKNLGIINDILIAEPTDGLWQDGRTDEDQLGISYDELEWAMNWYENNNKSIRKQKSKELNEMQLNILEKYKNHRKANIHKMKDIPVYKKNEI